MNIGINKTMVKQLFERKEVKCNIELYRQCYYSIWPCEDIIVRFLKTEGHQQKIDLAKQIYLRIGFEANFSLPEFLLKNLIGVENPPIDRREGSYLPKEHVVHSVNLYILGIYLFFNNRLFYERILSQFKEYRDFSVLKGDQVFSAFFSFLSSWRVFSLYHDLGYVFERGIASNGCIKTETGITKEMLLHYNMLCEEVIYDLNVKALARCCFCKAILKQSRETFGYDKILSNEDHGKWFFMNNLQEIKCLEKKYIPSLLANCKDMILLSGIRSTDSFRQMLPIISGGDYVTVILREGVSPVAIRINTNNIPIVLVSNECVFSPEDIMFVNEIWGKKLPEGYSCEFYLSKDCIQEEQMPLTLTHLGELLDENVDSLYGIFSSDYAFETHGRWANDVIFKMYLWIRTNVPLNDVKSKNIQQINLLPDDAKKLVIDSITKFVQNYAFADAVAPLHIESFIRELSSWAAIKLGEEVQHSLIAHDSTMVKYSSFQEFLRQLLNTEIKLLFDNEKKRYLSISKKGVVRLNYSFLGIKRNPVLIEELARRAETIGVRISQIKGYKVAFSKYDHGITSAIFLADTYDIYCQLAHKLFSIPFVAFAWPITPDKMNEQIMDDQLRKSLIAGLFAIVMHNIDVKHVSYKQDIQKDAFSYFSVFCDNLQIWSREYVENLMSSTIEQEYFSAEDFHIAIDENKILISTKTRDAGAFIKEKRDALNEYLNGASHLIRLSIEETGQSN